MRVYFKYTCASQKIGVSAIIKNTLSLLFVFLILTSLLNLFSNARVLLYACASQKIVRLVIIKNTLSKFSSTFQFFENEKLFLNLSLKNEEQTQPQLLEA